MRVIIQQCESREYLAEGRMWVGDDKHALAFPSGVPALDYIRREGLVGVQIVLKFTNDRFDLAMMKSSHAG